MAEPKSDLAKLVNKLGRGDPFVTVTVGKRSWRVPRMYIAEHGLKAWELPNLGFEEITQREAKQ